MEYIVCISIISIILLHKDLNSPVYAKNAADKTRASVQEPQQEEKSIEMDQSTSKDVSDEALGRPNGWSPREEEIDNVDMLDSFSPIGTMNDTRNTQVTSDKTFKTCAFPWVIAMLILVKIQGQ